MRKPSGRSIIALTVLLVAACDGDDAAGPSVETVAVIPGVFVLTVGDSLRLTTLARGSIGNPLVGGSVTWTSAPTTVASVSRTGVVTGLAAGSATITATVGGVVGTAVVTVSPSFAAAPLTSVSAGGAHTCALTASGAAYCWGKGDVGQLGVAPPATTCFAYFDFTWPCSLAALPVEGNPAFRQLAAGTEHTCGLTSDGTAYCWGSNANGQLGDGTTTTRNAPVAVATTVKFTSIDAGFQHTCGLTSTGSAYCWGRNVFGQLGDGTTTERLVPVPVTGSLTFRQLVAGGTGNSVGHTCALTSSGDPYCWGSNSRGQLGRSPRALAPHPVPALVSGGLTLAALATGLSDHVCGLTASGAAFCWGANGNGELGDGTARVDRPLPVAVSGGIAFTQLTTGTHTGGHTCGLTSNGVAYCWGSNNLGEVGDSSNVDRTTPTAVGGGLTFSTIDAGSHHTCARATGGAVYCWGSNLTGQLGINSTISSNRPAKVAGQP